MEYIWLKIKKYKYLVYIFCKKKDFIIIKEMVEPFFEVELLESISENDWTIYPYGNINASLVCFDEIYPFIKDDSEPKRKYLCDFEKRIIGIIEPSNYKFRIQIAVRLVRDIIKNMFLEKNMCYFHGGMIKYKNKGICIMGGKKSGKTSTILAILSTQKASFVSNDDISIIFDSGELFCLGWPRAISIRKDSILSMNGILHKFDFTRNFRHPDNYISELSHTSFVYVNELKEIFGCDIDVSSKIDMIIFPEFSSEKETEVIELENEEKMKCLLRNIEPDINRYFHDFEKCFLKDNVISKELSDNLSKIKMLKLKQNINNMQSTLEWIDKVIEDA